MRKLMCFTIGFTAACAVGIYLLSGFWYIFLGLCCLLCAGGALLFRSDKAKIAAMILLGSAVGFIWLQLYDDQYLSGARAVDAQTLPVTVIAEDYGFVPTYGEACDGSVTLNGKTYRVRCYLKDHYDISPGDEICGEFHFRYTADGGASDPTYHQGKGILLLAYALDDVQIQPCTQTRLRDYPAIWRHKILDTITAIFPQDTFAFAKALLLGDTTGLTYAQDRDFQVSGIRHIVAVSGLHVAILFSMLYLLVGRHRYLVPLLGIPMLAIFAAIAGFTPSIVRACVMQAIFSLSMLTLREYDPATSLSAAVLVILVPSPLTVTSVGFQLSVGCMVGIFLFSERLRQYFLSLGDLKKKSKGKSRKARMIRWIIGSVSVTLSAMVFTTPLCAVYFGMVSLVGVIANLLTLWIVSLIFYGIMLSCATALLWPAVGAFAASLISWPIRYVQLVSRLLADFSLSAVYTDSVYIILWLIAAYVLLGIFFALQCKHPRFTAIAIVLLLGLCIALSWVEPTFGDTKVAVLDVGQGQSVLIRQGREHYLVDCGGTHPGITADTVSNYLLSQGIFHLDGLIITHYDADHAGSIVNLMHNLDVDTIYMPDHYDSNGIRDDIQAAHPDSLRLLRESAEVELPGGKFILFPTQDPTDDNESSMCVLFQGENCDILITGDRSKSGERALLAQGELPPLELLVVGHHGSKYATSHELLAATRPVYAVISVGENNDYGHPHTDTLERLQMYGCRILRTDKHGTITFRR